MVVVEITRWPTPTRSPLGRVLEVLGDIDEPGVDNEIIIRKYGIPDEHGPEAVEEAKRLGGAVKESDIKGRTDFRTVHDRDDRRRARARFRRRDHDRAAAERQLLARRPHRRRRALRSRGRARSTRRPTSAARRSTFPSAPSTCSRRSLSTGLCSLNPDVDRLVQSCLMEIDRQGTVVRYEMHDGVIHSDARMTYTEVNAILTDRDQPTIAKYRTSCRCSRRCASCSRFSTSDAVAAARSTSI